MVYTIQIRIVDRFLINSKICLMVDFEVPKGYKVKLKDSEKLGKYLHFAK